MPSAVAIIGLESNTPADKIREVIGAIKGIPQKEVHDDMRLGEETPVIVMNLVWSLQVAISADTNTTVGDLIKDCERQLK